MRFAPLRRYRSSPPTGSIGGRLPRTNPSPIRSIALLLVAIFGVTLGVVGPARPAAALHPVASNVTWRPVATTGGGYVTGIAAAATSGTSYARTDIGGAYRWDTTTQRWVPILDQLPGLGDAAYGVDGLSVERDAPLHVWAAVGRVKGPATSPSGTHAVLRSTDGGVTWINTGFSNAAAVINGNLENRWTGHRIAIDQFDPGNDRAYLATRADGLWIHDNGTWQKASSVPDGGGVTPGKPDREGFAVNPVGVSFAALGNAATTDGTRAKRVYAAVWGEGVYRSIDGGATFALMAGSPKYLRQGLVSRKDGLFRGVGEGAAIGTGMGVWRLEGDDATWTLEQPCPGGCAGQDLVAIDVDNAGNIAVAVRNTTRAEHPIYYCTYAWPANCVGRWTNISDSASQPGWRSRIGLTGTEATSSLRFEPHPIDTTATKLLVGDYYGVALGTFNGSAWTWADRTAGIEITAATDLVAATTTLTAPRLYSGAIDVSGFRHDNFNNTPTVEFPTQGDSTQGGSQDATGIDVSSASTGRMVYRVGLAPNGHTRPGGWSSSEGATWTPFNNSSPEAYGGRISVSADNANRLVWLPETATPRTSTNKGSSWTVLGTPSGTSGVGFDTDNSAPLTSTRVSDGNATNDDFFIYDPSGGFHRATTTSSTTLAFTKLNNGLPAGDGQSWPGMRFGIAADPVRANVVVAGVCGSASSSRGFWFSSDRGGSFTKRSGIECAKAVAVGAPLPGGGPSTIYVMGKEPGGAEDQFFYSTDDGLTWRRLNRAGLVSTTSLTNLEADPLAPGRIYMSSKGRGVFTGLVA